MGADTKRRTISGIEIAVSQHPPRRAHRLAWRLGKFLPWVLARLDAKSIDLRADVAAFTPALGEMFARMSESESESLLCEILAGAAAKVDERVIDLSDPQNIDVAFMGNLTAMYGATLFALEVNFLPTIAGAFKLLADAPASDESEDLKANQ